VKISCRKREEGPLLTVLRDAETETDPDPDPAYHFDADPDPTCHFDADPDPDPTFHFDPDPDPGFQIKAENLEKVLKNRLIFHTFWLVICKWMRIRIQLVTLMRIQILPYLSV
jgi:hypothetical protein